MKECVYAEACEGMLEDMPVTDLFPLEFVELVFDRIGKY